AWRTGNLPAALTTVDRMPTPWAGMCNTMNMAAGRSAGNRPKISFRGAVAPAEPPMTMMSRLFMEPEPRCCVCTKASPPDMCLDGPTNLSRMSSQPTSAGPLSGRRVLVIEDEYFLADDIARALKDLGARVVGPVGELEEAASLVDADIAIDAAVVDINLRSDM